MSDLEIGYAGLAGLMLLLVLRLPVAAAMLVSGAAGFAAIAGADVLAHHFKGAVFARYSVYELSVIPLFLLMGEFATRGNLSSTLFSAANAVLGRFRGGVAMASVGACAGFGAICGSSLATAATMGRVALPELRRLNYDGGFAAATLAAGGTLGILIPPSIPLVIYGILTSQNILHLFVAAIVPALLAVAGYLIVIVLYVRMAPAAGPAGNRCGRAQMLAALLGAWPVGAVFTLVVGGIYGGLFTPTEAAAVGAFGTGLIALRRGALDLTTLRRSLLSVAAASGMIYFILLGGDMFTVFMVVSGVPAHITDTILALNLAPLAVLLAIALFYLAMGCVMDSLSLILLTVPIFFPVVAGLELFGLSPAQKGIWFGILTLVLVEVGQITPPVGMNVYVLKSMTLDVPLGRIFRSIGPFFLSDLVRVGLLMLFPALALCLL